MLTANQMLTLTNFVSQGTNAVATSFLYAFSLRGVIVSGLKSFLPKVDSTPILSAISPLILNMLMITCSCYDGSLADFKKFTKSILDESCPEKKTQKSFSFLSGALGGVTKGLSCFIAMYLVLIYKLNKRDAMIVSGFFSLFYALNQNLKITDALYKTIEDPNLKKTLTQATPLQKLDLAGHFLGEMTPGWILLSVFFLSFYENPSKATFATYFFISLLLGVNLGIGTTTQYAVDYVKPENHSSPINQTDEEAPELEHENSLKPLEKTSSILSTIGVQTKAILSFHSTVLLCSVFNHFYEIRHSLEIDHFKELEESQFKPHWRLYAAYCLSFFISLSLSRVQLPRLKRKVSTILPEQVARSKDFFKSCCACTWFKPSENSERRRLTTTTALRGPRYGSGSNYLLVPTRPQAR